MAAYGYTRVSTARQAGEGESLEVQQRTLTGYAMMRGLDLSHVYVERGVSGSIPIGDRPEGAAMLSALRPGDAVVSPKLDRMFRSALDALQVIEKFKARGIALHLLDIVPGDVIGNGSAKMLLTILAAFAEAERDRIRERVAQVKADQRERGRYLGGKVPFGFRVDGDGLVPDEAQQVAIRQAQVMRADGMTLRAIQAALKEAGQALSLDALHRVLKAPGSV